MHKLSLGDTYNTLSIQDAVERFVEEAYAAWGRLAEDKIELLAGVLHSRYGISREVAHEHIARTVNLNRFRIADDVRVGTDS